MKAGIFLKTKIEPFLECSLICIKRPYARHDRVLALLEEYNDDVDVVDVLIMKQVRRCDTNVLDILNNRIIFQHILNKLTIDGVDADAIPEADVIDALEASEDDVEMALALLKRKFQPCLLNYINLKCCNSSDYGNSYSTSRLARQDAVAATPNPDDVGPRDAAIQ